MTEYSTLYALALIPLMFILFIFNLVAFSTYATIPLMRVLEHFIIFLNKLEMSKELKDEM